MIALLSVIIFYLIGTFPSGHLVAKMHGVSITEVGSGNIGTTNVARVLGKKAGIYTLLLDCSKGLIGILLARLLFSNQPALIPWYGFCVVLGHCFSIPGKLKGGKGIATSLGVFIGLNPLIAAIGLSTFIALFFLTRIVSICSLGAAFIIPTSAFFINPDPSFDNALICISLVVAYRHKDNLQRLMLGTEQRFEFKKKN